MRQHFPLENERKIRQTKNHFKSMKIWKLMMLFLIFYLGTLKTFAQNGITMDLKNVSIERAFEQIKEETGYRVFYEKGVINPEWRVTVLVQNGTIDDVLKPLFKGKQIQYQIVKKQILLFKSKNNDQKPAERGNSPQTRRQISGYVIDSGGEPIVGVNIWNNNSKLGAITNSDGAFRIFASVSDSLTFSFIGFKTKKIGIDQREQYPILMEEEISSLGEITVVSSGYQDLPKDRVTGSFETISSKQIDEVPTINVLSRLKGKVAGVDFDVKNNSITIRGRNSYSGSKPLVVIDGFPMPQEDFKFNQGKTFQGAAELSYLNPDDIESISILKDAAASSIWGSRAANGVIVITTKKGTRAKEPSINIGMTFSIGDKPYLDKLKQMNSAQYVDFERELVELGYLADQSSNWQYKNPSEAQEAMYKYMRGESSEADMESALAELGERDNTSQIKKYLLRKAVSQQYNFSMSNATKTGSYFISGNYNKDLPVMKANEGESYNITYNNNTNLFNDVIHLSSGINYMSSKYTVNNSVNEALSTVSDFGLRPYDMLVDEDGNAIDKYVKFRQDVIEGFNEKGYLPWTYNYLDELDNSNVVTKGQAIRLNAELSADVTNWLSASVSGMYYKYTSKQEAKNTLDSYFVRNLINTATSYNETTGELNYGIPLGGYLTMGYAENENYNLRGQLSVNKTFNNIHSLNAVAVAEIRQEKRMSYDKTYYGYDFDTSSGSTINPTEYYETVYGWQTYIGSYDTGVSKYRNRYLSYVGTASYSLKSTYFLSGSIRFDDYSLLGADRRDRAMPLWSAGFRWKLKNESFVSLPGVISRLDLRMTYGIGGSTPTGGTGNNTATINLSEDYYTDLTTASISKPGNSQLKWETTKTFNVGVDYGVLNDRISGSFEYYTKRSNDILANMPFNATYGFTYLNYNVGTLSGHGVDINLNAKIIDSEFKWSSNFNFAYNTNKVTSSYYENTTVSEFLNSGNLKEGKAMGSVYAYRWAGLDEMGRSQIYDENGNIIGDDVSIMDLDPKILKYKGTTTAPYFGGWTNTFSYKSFVLGAQMTYYLGHVFTKPVLSNYPYYQGYTGAVGRNRDFAKRWKEAGDEESTNVPGLPNISYNSYSRYNYADINVLPAGHIRLNQVSLSYTLPGSIVNKMYLKGASISFVARNLGIIWRKNKEGYDPQYLATASYNTLTPSRNYVIRLSANF